MRVQRTILLGTALVLAAGAFNGCASTDGNMSNSVYETHRIVRNLEQDIGPNVTKLNETAADLVARVEASDQENRALRAIIQENQAKIDRLQQQLSELTRVMYRQMGLSQPAAGSSATVVPPGPAEVVAPPATTTVPPSSQTTMPQTTAPMEQGGSMMNQTTPPPPATAVTPTDTTPIQSVPQQGTPAATPVSEEAAEVDYISAQKAFIDEDYDTALTRYTEYLTRYPDGQSAHNAQFWKAESYRRLGQYENSIREFEYLEQRYGDVSDNNKLPLAMMKRAEAHISLGQSARATEILRDLIERYPMTGVVEGAKARLRSLEGE